MQFGVVVKARNRETEFQSNVRYEGNRMTLGSHPVSAKEGGKGQPLLKLAKKTAETGSKALYAKATFMHERFKQKVQ